MNREMRIELASRKLCELRGIDPNQMVAHGADPDPRGYVTMQLLHSPAWQRVAREVRAAMDMQLAIEFAEAA